MWTEIFKDATIISTGLSAVVFIATLFVWLQARESEDSVVRAVSGKGVVDPKKVVHILKQFTSDEGRLDALREVLGYDNERAADVLKKVEPNINAGRLSLSDISVDI